MNRKPYPGISQKLVLAFDIGTTYSSAAYAFLDPGQVPQIESVTRYIDNPNVGSAKIPSILYYDTNGRFRGVENGTGLQDNENLLQMKWWKLLLGPTGPPAALKKHMSLDLPEGKTIVDVFSDFMRYLFDSTKALFISSDQNREHCWNSVAHNVELVLTHPNGWGGPQQSQLKTAAVNANIVPDTQAGHSRIHFVTEGEASFHFCATQTQEGQNLKHGDKALIVDAGEGIIDISSYVVTKNAPLGIEELFQPKCLLQGGEIVTARAKEMVSEKLRYSKFDTLEDLETFAQKFDEGLKKVFSNDAGTYYIKFGSPRDNDPKYGIKGGRLALTGKQVSGFFEPSIQATVDSIREDFTEILSMNSYCFLIGEFATSPWLSAQLGQRLSDLGLKFFKPDTNTDRAVSIGAVSYHIDHFVKGRVSTFTYGIARAVAYNPSDQAHVKREAKTYIDELGNKRVPGAFDAMLPKGTEVLGSREIRTNVRVISEGTPEKLWFAEIVKYDGDKKKPQWMDLQPTKFETLCHVVANISVVPFAVERGRFGNVCYTRDFDVALWVGLPELKAQIRWIDSATGMEKSGDAVVVYVDASENSFAGPGIASPLRFNDWNS